MAFALRRLWGRARSRLASLIFIALDAATKRGSSPSQFSASLASLLASAPWWLTSLILAAALCAAKGVIGYVALTRRRRKLDPNRQRRRRSGIGGNGDDEGTDDLGASRPSSSKGGGAGRYGLFDDADNDRGSAGYEDDYASDPDDSATTLASHAVAREEEEEKAAAPLPFPNPKNVASLLLRQPSVASRGQRVPDPASLSQELSSSLHVARLEASPEFKNFLKSRGLTPEHAAATKRRLGAYRELRAADPPSFHTLLLSSSKQQQNDAVEVEQGIEAVPLGALELLVDSAAGEGCGALALLWWSRDLLSWLSSSSSSSPAPDPSSFSGVPALLAASTALALAGLASAAALGRPFALSVLFSGKKYWWEDSRGEKAGTPSAGRKAALAFSLDVVSFGAATLGLGCVVGAAARCLAVGNEQSSLGEKFVGVRLVKERKYRALAAAAE